MFRQASWGSLVLGKFRYVVFSFWLGRCVMFWLHGVGFGTSRQVWCVVSILGGSGYVQL